MYGEQTPAEVNNRTSFCITHTQKKLKITGQVNADCESIEDILKRVTNSRLGGSIWQAIKRIAIIDNLKAKMSRAGYKFNEALFS